MIAYIGGIVTVAFLPSLSYLWLPLLTVPFIGCRHLRPAILYYLFGVVIAAVWGAWQLHHRLPSSPNAEDVRIDGRVDSLVQHHNDRQVFTLHIDSMALGRPEYQRIRRIRLTHYHSEERFGYGDRVVALVRLSGPRGLYNPAARDTERFYLASGLDGRGYIRQLVLHQPARSLSVGRLRQQTKRWLEDHFEPRAAATLSALVIGDRTELSDQQWEWLRRTGTAHLLVVSGLHIAVMATLGWLLGRILAAPLLQYGSSRCGRLLPMATAMLSATAYAAMAGWELPVQRAWLMLMIFLAGNWQLLNLSGWQRLKVALLVIVTLQPLAVLEPGLWLSFVAVALILWQLQHRHEPDVDSYWHQIPLQWWRLQLGLFVGMSLVLVTNFNQLSPLGILINLIAVPWLSLTVWLLPGVMLLALYWPFAASALEWNLDQIWRLLQWSADAPGLVVQVGQPEPALLTLALAGVLVMLLPLPVRMRGVGLILCMPMVMAPSGRPPVSEFRAWVFDVGQGQAILIETATDRLLYDTGPGFRDGRSAFPYTVEPYLRSQAVSTLERVVVSHGDMDHSGGLSALKTRYGVGRWLGGEPLQDIDTGSCHTGHWKSGDVSFTLLEPFSSTQALDSNDRSCVLRIDNGVCSLLLTGDLSQGGEYRLLSAGKIEPVTWLVAGHHGSRDSTTGALLDYAAPVHVLVSAGYGNRFGHPHADVIERIESREIPWSSTALHGALLLQAGRQDCSITTYRALKKRYWTAG